MIDQLPVREDEESRDQDLRDELGAKLPGVGGQHRAADHHENLRQRREKGGDQGDDRGPGRAVPNRGRAQCERNRGKEEDEREEADRFGGRVTVAAADDADDQAQHEHEHDEPEPERECQPGGEQAVGRPQIGDSVRLLGRVAEGCRR